MSTPQTSDIMQVVTNMRTTLSGAALETLDRPFLVEEIKEAVLVMGPLKAPGPDGFQARFYQKFWDVVGLDVTQQVMVILDGKVDIKYEMQQN